MALDTEKKWGLCGMIAISAAIIAITAAIASEKAPIERHSLVIATPDGSIAVVGGYESKSDCMAVKGTIEEPWVDSVWSERMPVRNERNKPVLIDVTKKMTWRPVAKCIKGGV